MSELLYYDLKDASGVAPGLATQICRELGRRIIAGHFPEGGLIDDENKLCDRFGVSKSVVREAVKLLAGKGLLEVRRGSGTLTGPEVRDYVANTIDLIIQLDGRIRKGAITGYVMPGMGESAGLAS